MENGGLNMLDIDYFLMSLKAAWVEKIQFRKGKWADVFKYYITKMNIDIDYVWKTTFRNVDDCVIFKMLPYFYQEVLISFNKSRYIKPFERLNAHEIAQLPLWGSEYFKIRSKCMYIKHWLSNDILYVKDLFNEDGSVKNDAQLSDCIADKRNILAEVYCIKHYVLKRIRKIDMSIAPYVKIKKLTYLLFNNTYCKIEGGKSNMYYKMLMRNRTSRGNMESIFSKEFLFANHDSLWQHVYQQKITRLRIPKLCEFNYKLLHNFLPCGKILSKWKPNISAKCQCCNNIETVKHMLFDCPRVRDIWARVSELLKITISWKHIICGFPKYDADLKILSANYIISMIAYIIFKQNSRCKFENKDYNLCDLVINITIGVKRYIDIIKQIDEAIYKCPLFQRLCMTI